MLSRLWGRRVSCDSHNSVDFSLYPVDFSDQDTFSLGNFMLFLLLAQKKWLPFLTSLFCLSIFRYRSVLMATSLRRLQSFPEKSSWNALQLIVLANWKQDCFRWSGDCRSRRGLQECLGEACFILGPLFPLSLLLVTQWQECHHWLSAVRLLCAEHCCSGE